MSSGVQDEGRLESFQSKRYEMFVPRADNNAKKQKIEKIATVNVYDDLEHLKDDSCQIKARKTDTANEKKTAKDRLEMNRQRAKENRRRQKIMYQEMEKQIVFLKTANAKLGTENKTQQLEIDLLRRISQLLVTKQRFSPQMQGNYEFQNYIDGALNTNNNISQTSIPQADLSQSVLLNNANDIDNINSNILRTSIPSDGLDLSKILNSVASATNTNDNSVGTLRNLQHQPNISSSDVANTNGNLSCLLRDLQHPPNISSNGGSVGNTRDGVSNILRNLQHQSNGEFLRSSALSSTNETDYQTLQNIMNLFRPK